MKIAIKDKLFFADSHKFLILHWKLGAAILPVIIIISAIIMEVAIASVLVADIFGSATFNSRLANIALSAAQAGAQDGVMKVLRNCPIGAVSASERCFSPYQVNVGDAMATVIIKDDPAGAGQKIVISSSSILNRFKRIEAKLVIDQITGKTDIRSFKECYNYDSVQQLCI